MNNLSSYCGLYDARIRTSGKDLPVINQNVVYMSVFWPMIIKKFFRGYFLVSYALQKCENYMHNIPCRQKNVFICVVFLFFMTSF